MGQAKANRRARAKPHVHQADGGCCWLPCAAHRFVDPVSHHEHAPELAGCELRAGHDGPHRANLEWE